jgi:hypothetical protein
MKTREAKLERELWQTVEILFEHFSSKPTWTRLELAKALGNVHANTIYRDETLALKRLSSYEDSLKNPRGEIARKQRLTHYNVWVLVIVRCITKRYGQTKAATFLFVNEDKLTVEAFNHFKETRNARTTQARHISAA